MISAKDRTDNNMFSREKKCKKTTDYISRNMEISSLSAEIQEIRYSPCLRTGSITPFFYFVL